MGRNLETKIAWRFHDATRYRLSTGSDGQRDILMGDPHSKDLALGEQDLTIEPAPFKIYSSLDPITLPREAISTGKRALDAISSSGESGDAALDLATLAHLCLRSNGILKTWKTPSGKEISFRASGCTGARYHLELYLVTGELDGLDAGIYHYAAHDHSLRQLRTGDFRANLEAATANELGVATAPVIMVCTSTYWRNAWRYQERAYRHVYWDTGTLFTSLLAVASDAEIRSTVVLGFDDHAINHLIGIDGEREAAVALIALGNGDVTAPEIQTLPALNLPTVALSAREIDFPLIREMHDASSLGAEEVANWRRPFGGREVAPTGTLFPLAPLPEEHLPKDQIEPVILRRRSNRHYDTEKALPFDLFSTVLMRASRGTNLDVAFSDTAALSSIYLIVNNVEGIEPGSYRFHPELAAIELLRAGDQRADAQRLACDQSYASEAHVNVYALIDLHPVLDHFGNRGYRLAQFEAALFGGRLQLAAHALGLGAVGSTSADDDVTAHFSPQAGNKSFMFVAVFGIRRPANAKEKAASTGFIKIKDEG